MDSLDRGDDDSLGAVRQLIMTTVPYSRRIASLDKRTATRRHVRPGVTPDNNHLAVPPPAMMRKKSGFVWDQDQEEEGAFISEGFVFDISDKTFELAVALYLTVTVY